MILSDTSIKRPVFATVLSLLLVAFGVLSFLNLPLREYPDIDPPIVSIETTYPGAAASIVETRITDVIEERIAGIEGIRQVESTSEDGESNITIEFSVDRDIDAAANDVRDRVSGVLDNLPEEADPPDIQKVDSSDDVIMWLNLVSQDLTVPEITDFAERYLVDRFSVLDGVARVRVGGAQTYSIRIWVDRDAIAARNLTINDIEDALRAENVEFPAGSIESKDRQFTVRVERSFRSPEDFEQLVIDRGEGGHLVRLGEIARVSKEPEETRTVFRGNGEAMVGLGIIKQSKANTIAVAKAAQAEAKRLNPTLPEGMEIKQSYDTSIFIEAAIAEVYRTLLIAIGIVVLVIYLFLGSLRATLVPAVTVPVSLVATFIVLNLMGFSVNLLTLLALVLAIGLVVDDAIVVLENIVRRIEEKGETPLVAAFFGARQVAFAVIATTLVLIAVFVPIAFLGGDIGRLFSEFAITISTAVAFSSLVALSLSPMLASKVLKSTHGRSNILTRAVDAVFRAMQKLYLALLDCCLRFKWLGPLGFIAVVAASYVLLRTIPSEYAPKEDRGAFFVIVNGPEGDSHASMKRDMDEIERRLLPYVESGEVVRLLVRTPRSFGNIAAFNTGIVIFVLNDWSQRRSAWDMMAEIRKKLSDIPGVRAFPVMRQGFGSRIQKPVQFVIGGGTYEELAEWRDRIVTALRENNPGFEDIDWDYKETKPQIQVSIDYDRASELGVTVGNVGRTLETLLGSRRVTTYLENGEEYDVLLEGKREMQNSPTDLKNVYVRSDRTADLIPLSNLISIEEIADSASLNRFNRVRSITIEADLADGYPLGEALTHLNGLVQELLPESAVIDYKGQSRDFTDSGQSMLFIFAMGLLIVFLVLAAQFESFVHPFIIMLAVPTAVAGGLAGLFFTAGTLNLYTQIGLIVLIGIAAKNGILIVEFANQLRDSGMEFTSALREAARTRLRPILMTGLTTAAGAIPLILSFGAGAETRIAIGVVVLTGILTATLLTLFLVPLGYALLAKHTGSPGDVGRRLQREHKSFPTDDDSAPAKA